MQDKVIIAVVGMHRSGTSLLARGLKAAGLHVGNHLMPPSSDNPTGYWEDEAVVAINDKILGCFACDERSLRWIDEADLDRPEVRSLRDEARALILSRLEHHTHWAFKDPRTARLLPFWRGLFQELGIRDTYVIALRNPIDSIQSYRSRHHRSVHPVSKTWGYLLWMEYMLTAVYWTRDSSAVVVDYDNLLARPEREILRVVDALSLADHAWEGSDLNEFSTKFVDKNLQHFRSNEPCVQKCEDLLPMVSKAYSILRASSLKNGKFNYFDDRQSWEDSVTAFRVMSPAVVELTKDFETFRLTWQHKFMKLRLGLRTIRKFAGLS